MHARSFQQVHSSENNGVENSKWRREEIGREQNKLQRNYDNSDATNLYFTMQELNKAIKSCSDTSPGRDGLGYTVCNI